VGYRDVHREAVRRGHYCLTARLAGFFGDSWSAPPDA